MPLIVAATPIGNLGDASTRLKQVMADAQLVLAEDTRVARRLYSAFEIPAPRIIASHAHNEQSRTQEVMKALRFGENVLLLTDAGTPVVSDPGEQLVAQAHLDGHKVVSVPGPSAVVTALSVSGFQSVPFHFYGFLSRTQGKKIKALQDALKLGSTFILFESPHRIKDLIEDLIELAPDREICLCRELTKLHEEILRGPVNTVLEKIQDRELKGEVTLVIGPGIAPKEPEEEANIQRGQKKAAAALAKAWDLPQRDVYSALIKIKQELKGDSPE